MGLRPCPSVSRLRAAPAPSRAPASERYAVTKLHEWTYVTDPLSPNGFRQRVDRTVARAALTEPWERPRACASCGAPITVARRPQGRPRLYCDDGGVCRQRAHRAKARTGR
jgi:hypothetical protein